MCRCDQEALLDSLPNRGQPPLFHICYMFLLLQQLKLVLCQGILFSESFSTFATLEWFWPRMLPELVACQSILLLETFVTFVIFVGFFTRTDVDVMTTKVTVWVKSFATLVTLVESVL